MMYRLNDEYALRGWAKLDWVLLWKTLKKVRYLKREEFETLLLCDGETEIDDDLLDEKMKLVLNKYVSEGIIEECSEKRPLLCDQQYYRYANRYLASVTWSITGKCNFHCKHCFMDAPDGYYGELSTEQALDIVDQIADCGIFRIDITGGEPFVRKDFWQIVDRIIERDLYIGQIYTNGWLLTDEVLDRFESRGLFPEFCISFDGVGHHDWMRGIPGAEKRVIEAIKRCVKRGFHVVTEMCVHQGNRNVVRETVNTLSKAGVIGLKIGRVADSELWIRNCENNHLSRQDYYDAMIEYIPYFFKDGMPMQIIIGGVVTLKQSDFRYGIPGVRYNGNERCCERPLCNSARMVCYIMPDGRLIPCMPMTSASEEIQDRFPLVQDIGLKAGLSDSYYMEFIDRRVKDLLAANKKCSVCQFKYYCGGGCRASAVIYGENSLMGHDPDQCFFFENGYPDKIRAVCDAAIAKYCPDAKKDNE